MDKSAELLPGTLDMLILKAVSLKPLHGYGVLLRIRQISKDALEIPQGSLYPALYRLESHDLITAEWGQSENNRRAKYYTLTTAGRRREIGVRMALGAQPGRIRMQFLVLALRLLAAGTVLGLIGAWQAGRAMQSLLFQVPPLNVAVLAAAACVTAAVCLAACLLPARRAARISPMEALAEE